MAKLRAREKCTQSKMKVPLIIKEAEEGRRRVKFVERVKSGDQEDDFEEHSLSHIYTLTLMKSRIQGGSVADWSARWTRNPSVPGSSPPLATCWIRFLVFPSSNPQPRL